MNEVALKSVSGKLNWKFTALYCIYPILHTC